MNPTALFLQWVKREHPAVFNAAARKARGKVAFAGLGDDLMSDITFDNSDVTVDSSAAQAVDSAASGSVDTSGWSGFLDSLASAVSTVAPTIVQTKAQLAQIQVNQQRAQHGYGPYTGSLLSSAGGKISPMVWVGLLVIGGGVLLASNRKAR